MLSTHLSVSSISVESVAASLAGFVAFYTLLAIADMYLMVRFARQGPGVLGTGRCHNEPADEGRAGAGGAAAVPAAPRMP